MFINPAHIFAKVENSITGTPLFQEKISKDLKPSKETANMSKFFRGGEDSSTDSSSDEEELYSGEEEEEDQVAKDSDADSDEEDDDDDDDDSDDDSSDESVGGKQGAGRFLKDFDSDSEDSDDEVRAKVKSAKDKRLDELEALIKQIENGQKNGDWTLISTGMTLRVSRFEKNYLRMLTYLCRIR